MHADNRIFAYYDQIFDLILSVSDYLLAAAIWRTVGTTQVAWRCFCVLPSSLLRRCSLEANHNLHDVWPYPALLHYIYIFGGSCPLTEFARCKIHFTSKSCVLLYWHRYCMALQQRASTKLCGVEQRAPPIFGRAAIRLGIGPHF